jgi:hypothetical protein
MHDIERFTTFDRTSRRVRRKYGLIYEVHRMNDVQCFNLHGQSRRRQSCPLVDCWCATFPLK